MGKVGKKKESQGDPGSYGLTKKNLIRIKLTAGGKNVSTGQEKKKAAA